MSTIKIAKTVLAVTLSVATALSPIAQTALAYGGEDYLSGHPWHHHDITFRALAGDATAYSAAVPYRHPETNEEKARIVPMPEGAAAIIGTGFSRDAAMSVAWHADYLDSYLYNPFFWAEGIDGNGGFNRRLKASLAMYDDLATLHFDDTFSTNGINDNFERYAAGALIGLKWAADNNDVAAAHHILGLSLHAIQDFYSHSDWVNDPSRRNLTWFEVPPADRMNGSIFAGAFENNVAQAPAHHGAISASCSLLARPGVKNTIGPVCTGKFSPFQNMNFCSTFKHCDDEDVVTVDMSVDAPLVGPIRSSSLLYLSPKGMAIDSTLIARVGGEVRGLTKGKSDNYEFTDRSLAGFDMSPAQCVSTVNYGIECDHDQYKGDDGRLRMGMEKCERVQDVSDYRCTLDTDYLFAASKSLAIRASEQWIAFLEQSMIDAGEGGFWRRIKQAGSPTSSREDQFERFDKLAFQFITTGPYPIGNQGGIQSSDGYYLRVRIKTSDKKYAGSDADISLRVEGENFQQEILLDYLPTNDPNGRVSNPIFVYNDFERNDNDVYTVGPFPEWPKRITIINDAPSAGEVFVAFWRGLGEAVVEGFEKSAKAMRALVGGGVDYVNDDHQYYTLQEILGLQGYFPHGSFSGELRIKEKNEGDFGIRYSLTNKHATSLSEDEAEHKERRERGWNRFLFSFDEVFAYDESEIDGLSNSDELLIFASATTFNGDPNSLPMFYRSGVIDDVDKGETHRLSRPNRNNRESIILSPNSAVTVAGQIYESDLETTSERNDLWAAFTQRGDEDERTSKGFFTLAGEATASDLHIDHVVVTPFKRSIRPELGIKQRYNVKFDIEGGESFHIDLDKDHKITPIIPAEKPDLSSWFKSKPAASTTSASTSPSDATSAIDTATTGDIRDVASIRPEYRDSIDHLDLDVLTPEARRKFNDIRLEPFKKFIGPLNGVFQSGLSRRMSLMHLGDKVSGTIDSFGELEGTWDSATSTMTGTISYDTIQDGVRVATVKIVPSQTTNGYIITGQLEGVDHTAESRMTRIITIKQRPVKYSQYKKIVGASAEKTQKLTRTGAPRLSKTQPKADTADLSPYQMQYAEE